MGGGGHGCQIYQYTWSIGCCATGVMHLSHCPDAL